jgi:hypothetical protein
MRCIHNIQLQASELHDPYDIVNIREDTDKPRFRIIKQTNKEIELRITNSREGKERRKKEG